MKSPQRKKNLIKASNRLTFRQMPFSCLIMEAEELVQLRWKYSSLPATERRLAADWEYNASFASELFYDARGQKNDEITPWPGAVVALAIDPEYAPALLTVASFEYHYGRKDEAMSLFLTLPTLPEITEQLAANIDKGGNFLIDRGDYQNAKALYSAAARVFPNTPIYHNGLSYCLANLGRLQEAVDHAKHAVNLEPDNYNYLADLGWSLLQVEHFDEAQSVLERAVTLTPPEYKQAKGNLEELHRRQRS